MEINSCFAIVVFVFIQHNFLYCITSHKWVATLSSWFIFIYYLKSKTVTIRLLWACEHMIYQQAKRPKYTLSVCAYVNHVLGLSIGLVSISGEHLRLKHLCCLHFLFSNKEYSNKKEYQSHLEPLNQFCKSRWFLLLLWQVVWLDALSWK